MSFDEMFFHILENPWIHSLLLPLVVSMAAFHYQYRQTRKKEYIASYQSLINFAIATLDHDMFSLESLLKQFPNNSHLPVPPTPLPLILSVNDVYRAFRFYPLLMRHLYEYLLRRNEFVEVCHRNGMVEKAYVEKFSKAVKKTLTIFQEMPNTPPEELAPQGIYRWRMPTDLEKTL